jgi:hypothetical protein
VTINEEKERELKRGQLLYFIQTGKLTIPKD